MRTFNEFWQEDEKRSTPEFVNILNSSSFKLEGEIVTVDRIYRRFDRLCKEAKWDEAKYMLAHVELTNLPISAITGWMCIVTSAQKYKPENIEPYATMFWERCKFLFKEHWHMDPILLNKLISRFEIKLQNKS